MSSWVDEGEFDRTDPEAVLLVALAEAQGIETKIGFNEETPFERAVRLRMHSVVRLLLRKGCEVSTKAIVGLIDTEPSTDAITTMLDCIVEKTTPKVRFALNQEVEYNLETGEHFITPLLMAQYKKNDELVVHLKKSIGALQFPPMNATRLLRLIKDKEKDMLDIILNGHDQGQDYEDSIVQSLAESTRFEVEPQIFLNVLPGFYAEYYSLPDIITLLETKGAQSDPPKWDSSSLLPIILHKKTFLLSILLDKSPNLSELNTKARFYPSELFADSFMVLPLVYALSIDPKSPIVEQLVLNGAKPYLECEWKDGTLITPIQMSCKMGMINFLDIHYPMNPQYTYNEKCAMWAIEGGLLTSPEFSHLLNKCKVHEGNKINDLIFIGNPIKKGPGAIRPCTLLAAACRKNKVDYVKILLDVFGADPAQYFDMGQKMTLVEYCSYHGYSDILKLLLDNEAKPSRRCIDLAISNNRGDVLNLFRGRSYETEYLRKALQKDFLNCLQTNKDDIISFSMSDDLHRKQANRTWRAPKDPKSMLIVWKSGETSEIDKKEIIYNITNDASIIFEHVRFFYYPYPHTGEGKRRDVLKKHFFDNAHHRKKIAFKKGSQTYPYHFFMIDNQHHSEEHEKNMLEIIRLGGGNDMCTHWYGKSKIVKYLRGGSDYFLFFAYRLNRFATGEDIYERIDAICLVNKTGRLFYNISIFCANQLATRRGLGHEFMPYILDSLRSMSEPGRCLVSLKSSDVGNKFYTAVNFKKCRRDIDEDSAIFYSNEGGDDGEGIDCNYQISLCAEKSANASQPMLLSAEKFALEREFDFYGYPAKVLPMERKTCHKCHKNKKRNELVSVGIEPTASSS